MMPRILDALTALTALAGDATVHRIGWVLVHSLWQGAAVAAALAGTLRCLRNQSAAARYAASCAALLLITTLPLVTFAIVAPAARFAPEPLPLTAGAEPVARAEALASVSGSAAAPTPHTRWGQRLADTIPAVFPWLVGAWVGGVAMLSVWHFGGWIRVRSLRRSGTRSPGATWDQTVARLCLRMRVTRPVRLFESALVQVPTVVGWLRPVVLVPASALTGLTAAQLEAILAHELAHVRRHDYLVNLAQSVVETLLFYHPAVWWVSARIRLEREDCCDDIASRVCGGATLYARALAAMEELRGRDGTTEPGAAMPRFALAADGGTGPGAGSLLRRIRRLFGKPEPDRRARLAAWPAALVAAACPLLPLAAVAVGKVTSNEPTRSAVTVAPLNESAASSPADPADPREPGGLPAPENADVSAKRVELSRLIDERIKVSRELAEARNKLANLKTLSDTGQDPPGLNEVLANDERYTKYRQAMKELEAVLESKQLGDRHPRVLSARSRIEALRQKSGDVREEIRNQLFASLGAAQQSEIDANQKLLNELKEQIARAENEFARADAARREQAQAAAAPLSVNDIARVDPAMLELVRQRDELRRGLEKARLTMLPNNSTVIRLERELKLQEKSIADRAKEFQAKWVLNNGPAAQPEAPRGAAPPAPAAAPAVAAGGVYYVGGHIARPGAYTLGERPVNLLQALIAAGLDVETDRGRQVVLLRREDAGKGGGGKDNGQPHEVATTLTVGDLVDHREKDVFLRAGDTLLLKAAPPPAAAGPALVDPPAGLWQRAAAYLVEVGFKDLDRVTVISAYADEAAGEAFVALRKSGEKEENSAYQFRLRRKAGAWDVERPSRYGPLSAAGIGLSQFQKEFPNAHRFAEPLSVPPLKAGAKAE